MKTIFYAKETIFDGFNGFEFSQVKNDIIICRQFIKKEVFLDFINELGINIDQIKYI